MNTPQPRPGILDITPYIGGDALVPGVARLIKLASNESALGASPRAVEAYRACVASLHRYPDGSATGLRQALAARHGIDATRIVCGAGSDELIALLVRAYAGPGDEVLCSAHGFLMYPIAAKSVGATVVTAPEIDLSTDVGALLARVSDRTRLVFVASPNNPTGTYIDGDAMRRLHAGLPPNCLLVIDAAYAEYVSKNDYEPGTALVDAGSNVVMTRTFSKIYGLAALRVGWAYCAADVADVLNRIRGPFNVSAPALAAAQSALADIAFTDAARIHNDTILPWFREALARLDLKVNPSAGNFVIVRFPSEPARNAQAAIAHLRKRGIVPRELTAYGLGDWVRFSIGTEDEMSAAHDAVAEFLATS